MNYRDRIAIEILLKLMDRYRKITIDDAVIEKLVMTAYAITDALIVKSQEN